MPGDLPNPELEATGITMRTPSGTTPASSSTDTGAEANHVAEGSSGTDTIEAGPQTSSLHQPRIVESIQNVYHPLALRVKNEVQAFVASKPSPSDFWEVAKKSETLLQDYIPRLLKSAAVHSKSTKFTDITAVMNHIVSITATFRESIKSALDACNITFDAFTNMLEGAFSVIVNELGIPPPNKAPGHAERAQIVDKILDDATLALIELAARCGIREKVVATYLHALKPLMQTLIVTVGDINEQHPQFFPILAFCVAALLIPELEILGPFLSLFGFGLSGPVKSSTAALLQKHLFGGAVDAGSCFSLLQAAGMGVTPKWAELVAEVPLVVHGALAKL